MRNNKRNVLGGLLAVIITVSMMFSSITTFYAEGKSVKINGQEFKTGDTITFIVKMSDADEKIGGIDMMITYDNESLSLLKDTINIPKMVSPVCNSENAGRIIFNSIEPMNGMEFKNEEIAFSASFKILDNAKDNEVEATMRQMIDIDLTEMTDADYKLTDSVQEGTLPQDDIVNPGNGLERMVSEAETSPAAEENQKSGSIVQIILFIAIGAVAVLLIVVAIVANKKKKSAVGSDDNNANEPKTNDNVSYDTDNNEKDSDTDLNS